MVVNIGALAVPGFAPATEAFILATLLKLPLVLLGVVVVAAHAAHGRA